MRALVLSIMLMFAGIARAEVRPTALFSQLYSQNAFDSRTENFVTQNRLWVSMPNLLRPIGTDAIEISPFVGARFDQDRRTTSTEIFSENRASPSVGLQVADRPLGIGGFAEALLNNYQVTLYHYAFWRLKRDGPEPFFETYSDLSNRGSWSGNGIFAHWSKLGLRLLERRRLEWDVYPEIEFHRDRVGWAYENYTDFRYGTRLSYRLPRALAQIALSAESGLYQGDASFRTPIKALFVIAMDYAP